MADNERLERYANSAYSIDAAGALKNEPSNVSFFFAPWLSPQVAANELGEKTSIENSCYMSIDDLNMYIPFSEKN